MGTSESPIIMPSSHFAFILGLVAITTCLATNEHDQDALGAQYEKLYDLQAEHKDHEMQIIQIKTQMSKIKEKLSTGTLLATQNRQGARAAEGACLQTRPSVPVHRQGHVTIIRKCSWEPIIVKWTYVDIWSIAANRGAIYVRMISAWANSLRHLDQIVVLVVVILSILILHVMAPRNTARKPQHMLGW